MNFEHIILEKEQQDLFIQIVEKRRKSPRNDWRKMQLISTGYGDILIIPSNDSETEEINDIVEGDIETLVNNELLSISYSSGTKMYHIPPHGFEYYEWLMKEMGKPVERIEKHTFNYFDSGDFRKNYTDAYDKLKQAEELLWSSDSDANFSVIGHHCREAMQEFSDQLYNRVTGETSNEPKSHDKNRIKAVIEAKKTEIGTTVRPFLDALYSYWDALSNLVQRQVHAGQKEGEPINWEDARRVVFQTANVMFELHRTLGK